MKLECCNVGLNYEEAGRRDTETMGGCEVDYLICSVCNQRYELIRDSLDGDSLCMTELEP